MLQLSRYETYNIHIMSPKSSLILITCSFVLAGCSSPSSKSLFPNASVVAAGHSIRWVAPEGTIGTAFVVEAKSGKTILSQSITNTQRTFFFGAQDSATAEVIRSALGEAAPANREYRLYYTELNKK